jgi:hypothetical protein
MKMKFFYELYLEAIIKQLPEWKIYSKTENGGLLYRRNRDFVHWLGFQTSSRKEAVIAEYSIQALASQYDSPSVIITFRINNRFGENWWVTPDEWAVNNTKIIEATIKQVRPDPYTAIDIKGILKLTKNSRLKSPAELEIHAIALILNNQVSKGKSFLEKAFKRYKELAEKWNEKWDIENKNRVRTWLDCPNDQLLSLLRLDADKGALLLSLA